MGGWKAIQAMRSPGDRTLGDERIPGDGDFVETGLAAGSERMERRSRLKAAGYDFERVAERVAVIWRSVACFLRSQRGSGLVQLGHDLLVYQAAEGHRPEPSDIELDGGHRFRTAID
jgi:hypothetical protein